MKKLNAEQLKEHIKKNGITLVRTMDQDNNVPKGTKLWVDLDDGESLYSWDEDTEDKNNEFDYDFNSEWYWYSYKGLFELVEENDKLIIHCPTKEDYIKIVDKIGWDDGEKKEYYWDTNEERTLVWIKNNRIKSYGGNRTIEEYKEEYPDYKFITAKEFLHPLRIYGGSHTLPKEYLNQVNDKGTLTSYSTDPFGVYMDKNGKIKRAKYNLNNNRKGNKFMSIQNVIKSVKAKLSPVDRKLVKNGFLTSSGKRTGEYNEELQEIAINKLIDAEDTKEFRAELAKSLDK